MLYPWATKEYLLWEMSLGQIVMYFNLGMDLKYPQPNKKPSRLRDMSAPELSKIREDLRRQYGKIGD